MTEYKIRFLLEASKNTSNEELGIITKLAICTKTDDEFSTEIDRISKFGIFNKRSTLINNLLAILIR